MVERNENDGRGLNLTAEVRDGILHHTGAIRAETLEGRIVATADRIAYVNHDIDDAIRAGLLTEDALPASTHEVLGPDHSSPIAEGDRLQAVTDYIAGMTDRYATATFKRLFVPRDFMR